MEMVVFTVRQEQVRSYLQQHGHQMDHAQDKEGGFSTMWVGKWSIGYVQD